MIVLKKNHRFDAPRAAGLLALFSTYFFLSKFISRPEEQIHFFEYGLVGVLFFQALRYIDLPWRRFLLALALAAAAGWIDEIIQGLLPSRHYDVRDIFLNIISSFLGLLIYRLLAADPSVKQPPSS